MMGTEEEREGRSGAASDRWLWQRCRATDAPEDEAARFLDLAGFAEGLLDADDQERVAAWLADDPEAAADVNAARGVDEREVHFAQLERVIARGSAISPEAGPAGGNVVVLAHWRARRLVRGFAQWGSIAAAITLAGWLGFAMGTDTSAALTASQQQSEATYLPDLFDTGSAFLRDLGEGART
jgi:anti-sigma factor RsiW